MNNSKKGIPKRADRFLKWFCAPNLLEEVQGDLYESFQQNLEEVGERRARRRYVLDVLRFFNYSTIAGNRKWEPPKTSITMFKHYVRITLRLLAKNKVYFLINTLGLGITLSCCITAYLLFAFNLEFDHFHDAGKMSRTFKVLAHTQTKTGTQRQNLTAPMPLAPEAATTLAGIDRYTRFIWQSGFVQKGESGFRESVGFADSTFLEMFDFPLLHGSYHHFKDKYSIFLSAELAHKMFEDADPTGTDLVLHFQNEKKVPVTIGGVFDEIPPNNTFYFDALMRIENYLDILDLEPGDWSDWRNPTTFLELANAESADRVGDQLGKFKAIRNREKQDVEVMAYELKPFHTKIDGNEIANSYVNNTIPTEPMLIFGFMAGMILLIACFNLTNTSIAMSTKRLKEIGVRKAVGAARLQVIGQFLSETGVMVVISMVIGLLMAQYFIIPEFSAMLNFGFEITDISLINLLIALVLTVVTASLLAGIYPALFNSKLNPVELVKGTIKIRGTNWLTRILTASQFALTIIFLIAGTLFFQNIRFQDKIGFGYDKDRLIMVQIPGEQTFNILKNAIRTNPKVREVSGSYSHVGFSSWQSPVEIDNQVYDIRIMGIGDNYFNTVGLNVLEGTGLSSRNDSDLGSKVIVNQAFLERTSLKNPIDRTIAFEGKKRRIVGIAADHFDNLHRSQEVEPFLFYMIEPDIYQMMVVKTQPADLVATYDYLEETWRELFPHLPFDAQFQDEILLADSRQTNTSLGKIFLFLTILGTLMSIAGIFSLASLNIARRTKEIGIRKVLGASTSSIVTLINREFVIILTVAVFVGALGGFFLTETLLSIIYENHITVGLLPVALCAMLIFGAGYITTSGSILKATTDNPVDALRSE